MFISKGEDKANLDNRDNMFDFNSYLKQTDNQGVQAIRDIIIDELEKIEEREQIKILFAVESGSRAWGFPSKDSDYDVRFVYIHPIEWYLSIEEGRDVLECPINNLLDISGWDIKKSLKLFKKMNPALSEWVNSPIVYLSYSSFLEQLRKLQNEYYSPKSSIYHYLNMANRNYREYLQSEKVRVKKYFYVLRPILACKWIENNNTVPPLEFEKLLDSQVDAEELYNQIKILLEIKKSADELDIEPRIDIINRFLDDEILYYKHYVEKINNNKSLDIELLDSLFLRILEEVWGIEYAKLKK